jgi:hypothetical protein
VKRIITIAIIAIAAAALLLTGVIHVDWLPALHTYGLSFGTATHYCFADLVSGHVSAGCESAS